MLNRKQILKIRELNSEGFSIGQISKELKISYKTVQSYLNDLQLSTESQNIHTGGSRSIPNDDSEIPSDPSKVLLAPSLQKKLSALGMMTSEDIFKVSPKLYYSKLNDVERTALKIFLQKHDAAMVRELKEIENEAFRVAKEELDRLYNLAVSGEIDLEKYDVESELILLEMEAEFSQ